MEKTYINLIHTKFQQEDVSWSRNTTLGCGTIGKILATERGRNSFLSWITHPIIFRQHTLVLKDFKKCMTQI